MKTQVESA